MIGEFIFTEAVRSVCGFVFVRNPKEIGRAAPDPILCELLLKKISHRGPDDFGIKFFPKFGVTLLHTRLSVIDLSTHGKQPMTDNQKRYWIVFNGEIYNFIDLKIELQALNHEFNSQTDTEVLLHAYLEWGPNALLKINGMFSFVIFDSFSGEFFAARDRMGERPFYYSQTDDFFIAGSEIKALIPHPRVGSKIDNEGIYTYLRLGYTPSPVTCFKNINKLESGQSVISQKNKITFSKYWQNNFITRKISQEDASETLRYLFCSSVKLRLRSDVPLGIYLSGGIDSTLVAHHAVNLNQYISAFSSSFDIGERSFKYNDDSNFAKKTAKKLGIKHYDHQIIFNNNFKEEVNTTIAQMDEPNFVATNVTMNILARYVRSKGIKVMLDGTGGDELFAGYSRHLADRKIDFAQIFGYNLIYKVLQNFTSNDILKTLSLEKFGVDRILRWNHIFEEEEMMTFFHLGNSTEDLLRENIKNKVLSQKYKKNTEALLNFDQNYWLSESQCMSSDKMNMYNGIEVRSPFLDHRLVEFANQLPLNLKIKNSSQKYILKNSFSENMLPKEIANRPKTGWFSPVYYWLKDFLYEEYNNSLFNLVKNGICKNAVLGLDVKKNPQHAQKIWSLYVLDKWMEAYIN